MQNSSNLCWCSQVFPRSSQRAKYVYNLGIAVGPWLFSWLKVSYIQFDFKYESKHKLEPLTINIFKIYAIVSVSKESLYGYSMDSMMDYMDIV